MGLENPFVFAHESGDRNRLWRRKREVVEYAPIGRALVPFRPCGVQSLRERLACGGILILAQPQEIIRSIFRTVVGMFTDPRAEAKVMVNIRLVAPGIWGVSSDETRHEVGLRYAASSAPRAASRC